MNFFLSLSCLAGLTGPVCETNIDDCSPDPCFNEAECVDLINGYNCTCLPGFTGLPSSQLLQ